jgi:hypothetical protein
LLEIEHKILLGPCALTAVYVPVAVIKTVLYWAFARLRLRRALYIASVTSGLSTGIVGGAVAFTYFALQYAHDERIIGGGGEWEFWRRWLDIYVPGALLMYIAATCIEVKSASYLAAGEEYLPKALIAGVGAVIYIGLICIVVFPWLL